MANLLFLVHRLPFPPDKGDKVRSFHLLSHLAAQHRTFVGTFYDDLDDRVHVDTVRSMCTELHAEHLEKSRAQVASLGGLFAGRALTLSYYRRPGLQRWVNNLLARERIDAAVVFSSSMAQYVAAPVARQGLPLLVDFVDVDSAKWSEYAPAFTWPKSWLYRREGRKMRAVERQLAGTAAHSFFVTRTETELFLDGVEGLRPKVDTVGNGVDAEYFKPDAGRVSPFDATEIPIVFTGAMDYWPNVDAVIWFVREMLPELKVAWPSLRFHIVGRGPTDAVKALAGPAVHVTGTVPDVRPYLQHAAVVVAPMRVARGIQNKIVEAMAMGRPVVAAVPCVASLDAVAGTDLLAAATPRDFVQQVSALLRDPARARQLGLAARQRIQSDYRWSDRLAPVGRHIDAAVLARAPR
jgi:polysaccharide biosynthesis protein PslH